MNLRDGHKFSELWRAFFTNWTHSSLVKCTLMLHKQHGSVLLKTFIRQGFYTFLQPFKDITNCEFEKGPQNRRVVSLRESRWHRISFVVKG